MPPNEHDSSTESAPSSAPRDPESRARQTLRDAQRREHQTLVKMNDAEYEKIAANAAACGLGVAHYLRSRGMEDLHADGGGVMSRPMLSAWVAELYALKRVLRGSATNFNQLTRLANVIEEIPAEAWHHLDRIARMEQRVTALLDAVDPELKPRR